MLFLTTLMWKLMLLQKREKKLAGFQLTLKSGTEKSSNKI